jgi:hypothetical protein
MAAFGGAFIGARLMKKVTWRAVLLVVGGMLILVGTGTITDLF